jgi:hypothetical protein
MFTTNAAAGKFTQFRNGSGQPMVLHVSYTFGFNAVPTQANISSFIRDLSGSFRRFGQVQRYVEFTAPTVSVNMVLSGSAVIRVSSSATDGVEVFAGDDTAGALTIGYTGPANDNLMRARLTIQQIG